MDQFDVLGDAFSSLSLISQSRDEMGSRERRQPSREGSVVA
jgi:hypothetical protein